MTGLNFSGFFTDFPDFSNQFRRDQDFMLITNMEDASFMSSDVTEIKGVELTDSTLLSVLKRAPLLDKLDISGCEKLTDESCTRLLTVPSLREIDLTGCHLITDTTVKALATLPRLRVLALGFCYAITDDGLKSLTRVRSLEKLLLWSCEAITDQGIVAIAGLPSLSWLELPEFAEITDVGISSLADSPSQLHVLRLTQLAGVSDSGILLLSRQKELRILRIEGCRQVSKQAIAELQSALPQCQIIVTN